MRQFNFQKKNEKSGEKPILFETRGEVCKK